MVDSDNSQSKTSVRGKWEELSPKARLWSKISAGVAGSIIVLALTFNAGYEAAKNDVRKAFAEAFSGAGNTATAASSSSASSSAKASTTKVGTRENPAPLGTSVLLSDRTGDLYEVTLSESVLNANALIAKENRYNDAAPAGKQFATVKIDVKYVGSETGKPSSDIDVTFVTKAGTTHEEGDVSVVGPAEFYKINELYKGGTGSAVIVIAVPTADIESGNWVISAGYGGTKYFFKAV